MSEGARDNRDLVLEAMTSLFQKRDAGAVDRLYAVNYIQHNPGIAQGRQVLRELVSQLPPSVYYEPGMVISEGAFVAIHGRIRGWSDKPQVVVDIFRVEDGRLAEHWDVLQDEVTPATSTSGVAMFSPDEAARQAAWNSLESRRPDASAVADALLQANLARVFGERDAERRARAIEELYTADAVLLEPAGAVAGHRAINDAVSALLRSRPASHVFAALGPAVGHHGAGLVRWRFGPPGDATGSESGTDVATFAHGRIRLLHVFPDSLSTS